MPDPDERIRDLLAQRPLTVELPLGLERRVWLYADRLNKRLAKYGDTDPYQPGQDDELANVILLLCEAQLDHDEHASGLTSDPVTGRLTSREQADEQARRRAI